MSNVIYVDSNTFLTTGDYRHFFAVSDDRIKMLARQTVGMDQDEYWDPLHDVLEDSYPDGVSLTEDTLERDSVTEHDADNVIQYVKEFRVSSVSFNGTETIINVVGSLDRGYFKWGFVNEPNLGPLINPPDTIGISDSGISDYGGAETIVISGNTDPDILTPCGIRLSEIYLDTPDPTKVLVKIFDTLGNLLASGYPNEFGYFDPHFSTEYWQSVLKGSENCQRNLPVPIDPTYATQALAMASPIAPVEDLRRILGNTYDGYPQNTPYEWPAGEILAYGPFTLDNNKGLSFILESAMVNTVPSGDYVIGTDIEVILTGLDEIAIATFELDDTAEIQAILSVDNTSGSTVSDVYVLFRNNDTQEKISPIVVYKGEVDAGDYEGWYGYAGGGE